jgi:hypothetical protein
VNDNIYSFARGLMSALLGETPVAPVKVKRTKRAKKVEQPAQLTLADVQKQVAQKMAEERAKKEVTPSIQDLDEMFNLNGPAVPDGFFRPADKYGAE